MHIVSLIIALQKQASCQFVAFVRFQYPHLVAHLRKNVLFCSKASKVEQALVIGLGAFNLVGVIVLSGMLRWEHHVLQTAQFFFISCMVVLCKSPKGTKGCCKNSNGSAPNEQRNTTVGFSEWLLICGRGLEFCWVQWVIVDLWKRIRILLGSAVWVVEKRLDKLEVTVCLGHLQFLFVPEIIHWFNNCVEVGLFLLQPRSYPSCRYLPNCLLKLKFFYFGCIPLHKTLNPILD